MTKRPKLSKTVLHTALTLVSGEMLSLELQMQEENKRRQEIAAKHWVARDELAAWKDYRDATKVPVEEGGISQQDYDTTLTALTQAEASARREWETFQRESNERFQTWERETAPSLHRRWKVHSELAKELGMDLSSYWVFGKPIPEKATPAEG